jgi:hypothetical protein
MAPRTEAAISFSIGFDEPTVGGRSRSKIRARRARNSTPIAIRSRCGVIESAFNSGETVVGGVQGIV